MNEKDEKQAENPTSTRSTFPKKTLAWTILVGIILLVLFSQAYTLNEMFNMNPAIPWLALILLVPITILVWAFWAFFIAKARMTGIFILLSPVAFLTLYYPNFKGDANFAGFRPRFWTRAVDFVEAKNQTLVDVKTTTPLDFPQFLGPDRNGIVNSVTLADSWTSPPQEVWKIGIGEGWSSFVAVNGYAITQEQRADDECVTCYDINTAELKWINIAKRRHEDVMAMGKVGPRATPTVDNGMVYVTSGTGILECLDGETGKVVWSADVPDLVGIEQIESKNSLGLKYTMEDSTLAWGRSASPLIEGSMVIVPAGGVNPLLEKKGAAKPVTLIAFDKLNGKEIWRGGSRAIAYGSPVAATIGGKRQILLVTESYAVGHDVESGEELWNHAWLGQSNGAANCSNVTVVSDSELIVSKGYGQGGELIKVTQSPSGEWEAKSAHKDPRLLKTKFSNPVLLDGHAYSLSDGYLECTHASTFERKWKQRGRFGNGQVLLVGDKLLVHSETGTLFLVKATPEGYKELGKVKTIEGICWNTICLYGDLLLVRSEIEAACYRLPLKDAPTDAPTNGADLPEPTEPENQ